MPVRRVLLVVAIIVTITAFPLETRATTFTGEIVGTATTASSDVFWTYFDPGETWTFLYSYDSGVIDGTFSPSTGIGCQA